MLDVAEADDADAYAGKRLRLFGRCERVDVRSLGFDHAGQRCIDVACVEVRAGLLVAERIQYGRCIFHGAAGDTGTILIRIGTDGAFERDHALGRDDQRCVVIVGWTAARTAGRFADRTNDQVGCDRSTGATARSGGHAFGVIRIAGHAAPRFTRATGTDIRMCDLGVASRIAAAAVVFRVVSVRVDDCAGRSHTADQGRILAGEVGRVLDVATAGRANIRRIVNRLERHRRAVQRHVLHIEVAAVFLI